jgi:hypothetical protein
MRPFDERPQRQGRRGLARPVGDPEPGRLVAHRLHPTTATPAGIQSNQKIASPE